MRLIALAVPAVAVLLAGACGSDDPAGSPRPPAPPSASPTTPPVSPTGTAAPTTGSTAAPASGAEVALLSEPVAGGSSSPVATRLDGQEGVETLTAELGGRLAAKVADAVSGADVPAGEALYGAIVAVGCDVPAGVTVSREGAQVLVTPDKPTGRPPECYAPITTVAVVRVPDP
ncbi:hypothetical protein [Nocardioides pantholopis]|uniref:hypothetical protein n=1 Tax=Nocardioides pantholopis TaxID=2483798 RepID=UPI000F0833E5|nr:hypothetical protein [Nocardioides pantholopis]